MKLCKDCVDFFDTCTTLGVCTLKGVPVRDAVRGDMTMTGVEFPQMARAKDGTCGPEGKHFRRLYWWQFRPWSLHFCRYEYDPGPRPKVVPLPQGGTASSK